MMLSLLKLANVGALPDRTIRVDFLEAFLTAGTQRQSRL